MNNTNNKNPSVNRYKAPCFINKEDIESVKSVCHPRGIGGKTCIERVTMKDGRTITYSPVAPFGHMAFDEDRFSSVTFCPIWGRAPNQDKK